MRLWQAVTQALQPAFVQLDLEGVLLAGLRRFERNQAAVKAGIRRLLLIMNTREPIDSSQVLLLGEQLFQERR
ncbi:MAG TPA: hypothetical protein VK846_12220 [Candidatus Limnocylindria bacterium]|nr:hypothetical protein [Candidatus Limnocylindria bacterium]